MTQKNIHSSLHPEILSHISALQKNLSSEIYSCRLIKAEIDCIRSELQIFLSRYYREVGFLFQELEKLDRELNVKNVFCTEERTHPLSQDRYAEMLTEVKREESRILFRKLAKQFHPDAVLSDKTQTLFSVLSEAYKSHDLEKLIELDISYNPSNHPVLHLEQLEKKYALVSEEKELLLEQRVQLLKSPEFYLMQKVRDAETSGQNLIGTIKDRTREEISIKRLLVGIEKAIARQKALT